MSYFSRRMKPRLLVVLSIAAFIGFAHAEVLSIVTETRPPRQMEKGGEVVGTATERVRRVMEEAGIPYSIAVYPFARSMYLAQKNENTCIFSIARNAEREKLFVWIDTPVMQIKRVFFARADAGITLQTIEDAKRYRIGTYDKDMMDSYLRERGYTVDPAPTDENNIQKLLANRIDLWVNDEQIGQYEIDEADKRDVIVPVFTIMTQDIYLACNPNVPTETIQKLNRAAKSAFR